MFTVSVETTFSATHRLRLYDGSFEPLHGHDWGVRAVFASQSLDDAGMVVDFEAARGVLERLVTDLSYRHLNDHPAFSGENPTAEIVARHIYRVLEQTGPKGLQRVEVTEAPGCIASYTA